MFATTDRPQILLKLGHGKAGSSELAIGSARLGLTLEPLMSPPPGRRLGARAAGQWWLASVDMRAMGATPPSVNAWDLCHRILADRASVGGAEVEFAEPDLEQQWSVAEPPGGFGFNAAGDPNRPNDPQNPDYNTGARDDWFRNGEHSQLDLAREAVGDPPDDERVRIAHFDTGYDPDHATFPRHVDTALQRNFVDPQFPNDARDRTEGFFTQLGHGTGTLGILAGKDWGGRGIARRDLGGAPFARIVPVRVANSVVLFRTSAIAKAFDYVSGLSADPATRVDVVTMSMGGLASQAWADAVNRAYDAGIFIVTAAGNNYGNLPTRYLVYPARFKRVVAACGVQARMSANELTPYADLSIRLMAGNYGPDSKLDEAMSGFTPNVPWARIHSGDKVDFDGGGTSSATPQIAAAAAIWIQRHRAALEAYGTDWMRVEAVRHALFSSALFRDDHREHDRKYFGRGALRASDALAIRPPDADTLVRADEDDASWALIRGLAGLSITGADTPVPDRMLALELLQAAQSSRTLAEALGDPDSAAHGEARLARFREALAEEKGLSAKVRQWLDEGAPKVVPQPPEVSPGSRFLEQRRLEFAKGPPVSRPPVRRLKVFTTDPAAAATTATRHLAHTTITLPWSDIGHGPVDDYFEVVDVDPSSGSFYAPVDLNHPHLLASDGLAPSESDPRFHQQMVYAVARKTVDHFEEALGRPALWSPRQVRVGGSFREQFVRRLRIYPHALREANAYYSPTRKALLFGYFQEEEGLAAGIAPGSTVFTCLSYDVVAHETAHALLDGLHRRYVEVSNPDARAFHEAFADLVALFQHFTHVEALKGSIARAQGRDFDENLTSLAVQFGRSVGQRGALRSALGVGDDGGRVTLYNTSAEPHARGAVLVAAMFDAFLDIYRRRSADLVRIATQGTGILPDGEIHPDLVDRLAREAAKAAGHILRMLIRALDYCPPTSVTLGDYLRALITSDFDLVPDDIYDYRTAIVSAFRQRGIHPRHARSVSADSLRWAPPEIDAEVEHRLRDLFAEIDEQTGLRAWKLETERSNAYALSRKAGGFLANALRREFEARPYGALEAERLGFLLEGRTHFDVLGAKRALSRFEVHSVRPARRITSMGQERLDLVVEVTQSCRVRGEGGSYRGGATWIVDAETGSIRYCVRKRFTDAARIDEEQAYRRSLRAATRWNYYGGDATPAEPFALVHRGDQEAQS